MTTAQESSRRKSRRHATNAIPKAIQAEIRARMDEPGVNREALAKELGIASSTMYYYIRKFKGKVARRGFCNRKYIIRLVKKYFPHYTGPEIEAMKPEGITISRRVVNLVARRHGIRHTPETMARIKEKRRANMRAAHTPEGEAKSYEKRRRTVMMERLRVNSGMPQRTRLKFKSVPTRHRKAAWRLCRTYNYFTEDGSPFVFYFDGETHRTPYEQMYVERYKFKFEQAQG